MSDSRQVSKNRKMEDCKVLNVVNVSLIAQQIYMKVIKCTLKWFSDGFWVVCGSLRWFAVFQWTAGYTFYPLSAKKVALIAEIIAGNFDSCQ